MPAARRHRHSKPGKPGRRRALELIAGAGPSGFPATALAAHGFTTADIMALVWTGLAAPRVERPTAQGRELDISYLRITDAGREALAKAMV